MLKAYNPLRYPLNGVFSAASHIAILRVLKDTQEGMSGRAIAREAGVNHQACVVALRRLESPGVVQRQGSGRTQLIRLNFDNQVVQGLILPLLRGEKMLWGHVKRDISEKFGLLALSGTLFGSAARGQARPGSDIDLLLLVETNRKANAIKGAREFRMAFERKYGIHLSSIILSVNEAKKRMRSSDPLLKNILREGVDLLPNKLSEVIG